MSEDQIYPFISNGVLLAVGACIYAVMLIAAPILYGREEARGGNPEEAIWFWGTVFCAPIIGLWPLAIVLMVVIIAVEPIARSLVSVGTWLAENERRLDP